MTKMARIMFALGLSALLVAGCGKAEETAEKATDEAAEAADKAAEEAKAMAEAAAKKAEEEAKAAAEAAKAAAGDAADYVKVISNHEPKSDSDPVVIEVESFEITKATFDPENLEGGMVEMSLDLNSIKSNSDKRDGHLKTADYLDTANHGTAMVKISDVKKDGEMYKAQAEVTAHGQTKTFPVSFEVVETMEDAIRVKATHSFSRLDFGIGKEPDGENEKVATEVSVEMMLTIKKA